MNQEQQRSKNQDRDTSPMGFDVEGWPLPEVRSMMIDNFARSWRQHWLAAIVLFVISAGLVLFGTWLVTPTWEGYATLEVQPAPMPNTLAGLSVMNSEPLTATTLTANIPEIVRSYGFLADVIKATQYDQHLKDMHEKDPDLRTRIKDAIVYIAKAQFLRKWVEPDWNVKALEYLSSDGIAIAPAQGTTELPLYVYSDDVKSTLALGDAVMDQLQKNIEAQMRSVVDEHINTLTTQLNAATKKVAEDDQKQTDFRTKLDFGYDPALYAQNALEAVAQMREQKATFKAQVDSAQALVEGYFKQLQDVPAIVDLSHKGEGLKPEQLVSQKLQLQITSIKSDRDKALQKYGPSSVEVKGLDAQLATVQADYQSAMETEQKISTQQSTVVQQLDPSHLQIFTKWSEATTELAALKAKQEGLDAAIETLMQVQRDAIKADIELKRIQDDAQRDEAQLQMLDSQLRQFQDLRQQGTIFKGLVVRSKTAVLNPNSNDYPGMLLAALIALALGVFCAFVLPVAYDYLNQTILSNRQASSIPGVRVVAYVPRCKGSKWFSSVSN